MMASAFGRMAAVTFATTAMGACVPAQNGVENADPPAAVVSSDSRVTMERFPCYGTCPVYRVGITADGVVTFTGERFVDSTGTMTHRIEPAVAAGLMQELAASGFFELADKYTYDAKECGMYHTDAPRVTLVLHIDGRSKTVEHDYGCGGAPATLRSLQERVDSVAGVARWVGRR
jgi:hypothetical protein